MLKKFENEKMCKYANVLTIKKMNSDPNLKQCAEMKLSQRSGARFKKSSHGQRTFLVEC